jgi:hypothetical protein
LLEEPGGVENGTVAAELKREKGSAEEGVREEGDER